MAFGEAMTIRIFPYENRRAELRPALNTLGAWRTGVERKRLVRWDPAAKTTMGETWV